MSKTILDMSLLTRVSTPLVKCGRCGISTSSSRLWRGVKAKGNLPDYLKKQQGYVPHPWDKRFPVRYEEVSPDKHGGSEEMARLLPDKGRYCTDPSENCHLNVKKIVKNLTFKKKNCQKLSFFSKKLPVF